MQIPFSDGRQHGFGKFRHWFCKKSDITGCGDGWSCGNDRRRNICACGAWHGRSGARPYDCLSDKWRHYTVYCTDLC